jgi:hypothetical protein
MFGSAEPSVAIAFIAGKCMALAGDKGLVKKEVAISREARQEW